MLTLLKRLAIYSGLTVALLVISQLVGLAVLWYSVASYADYWKGRANQSGSFLYIAVGDSAAQGIGASQPQNGYVGLIARAIQDRTGRTVQVINLSVTGATLQDALRNQTPQLADYVPDLVTVEIGANDMDDYDAAQFTWDYDKLLQSLPPGRAVVSDMPYFGTRPEPSNRNARDANQIIRQAAAKYDVPVANLFDSLQNRQTPLIYASDFFHPNNRGYRIWYDAFWPQVAPLVKS